MYYNQNIKLRALCKDRIYNKMKRGNKIQGEVFIGPRLGLAR